MELIFTNLVLLNLDIICFAEVDGFVVVLVVVFVLSALVNDKVLFLHHSERPGLVFVGGGDRRRGEGGQGPDPGSDCECSQHPQSLAVCPPEPTTSVSAVC